MNWAGIGWTLHLLDEAVRTNATETLKWHIVGPLAAIMANDFRKERGRCISDHGVRGALRDFLQARVTAVGSPCILSETTVDYVIANGLKAFAVENTTARRSLRLNPMYQ